jgi:hypothetical protein
MLRGMGEWRKLIPHRGQEMAYAVIGALALATVQVFTWTGRGSWGTVFASLFLVFFTISWWRIARTGVYIGPRGVKLYHPFKRVEVVPWKEVVRFEACPVRLPNFTEEGAVICLMGAKVHPTPLKLSRSGRYNLAAYHMGYDVVLPEEAFFAAVHTLNEAVRPPHVDRPL